MKCVKTISIYIFHHITVSTVWKTYWSLANFDVYRCQLTYCGGVPLFIVDGSFECTLVFLSFRYIYRSSHHQRITRFNSLLRVHGFLKWLIIFMCPNFSNSLFSGMIWLQGFTRRFCIRSLICMRKCEVCENLQYLSCTLWHCINYLEDLMITYKI